MASVVTSSILYVQSAFSETFTFTSTPSADEHGAGSWIGADPPFAGSQRNDPGSP